MGETRSGENLSTEKPKKIPGKGEGLEREKERSKK